MNKKAVIGGMLDGWEIILDDGVTFSWNHNDPDFTEPLLDLLEHLGFDVTVEEWW